MLEPAQTAGRVLSTSHGTLVHSAVVEEAAGRVLAALGTFHATNPSRAGLGRDELLGLVQVHPDMFDLAVGSLCDAKKLEQRGAVIAQAGWSARLADPDQRLCQDIAELFRQAGWASPAVADLAAKLGAPPERVEEMMRLLQERGLLVRLEEQICMHRDSVEAAREVALRLFARAPSFSTMQFRDALRVSRKYAVPLLDHLDRIRFTVRSGHNRTPGVEARKQMKPTA